MQTEIIILYVLYAAGAAVLCFLLRSDRLRGPSGAQGHDGRDGIGIQGPPGPQGPPGVAPLPPRQQRHEMLKHGLPTGHFVEEGSHDYQEAFDTPGLSLRSPDGSVTEGKQ